MADAEYKDRNGYTWNLTPPVGGVGLWRASLSFPGYNRPAGQVLVSSDTPQGLISQVEEFAAHPIGTAKSGGGRGQLNVNAGGGGGGGGGLLFLLFVALLLSKKGRR